MSKPWELADGITYCENLNGCKSKGFVPVRYGCIDLPEVLELYPERRYGYYCQQCTEEYGRVAKLAARASFKN